MALTMRLKSPEPARLRSAADPHMELLEKVRSPLRNILEVRAKVVFLPMPNLRAAWASGSMTNRIPCDLKAFAAAHPRYGIGCSAIHRMHSPLCTRAAAAVASLIAEGVGRR